LSPVFAPTRFHHQVVIRWEEKDARTGKFVTRGRVAVPITGGRDQGFRTYSVLSDPRPGLWRAGVETEDGRLVGRLRFRVLADAGEKPRRWNRTKM
jgi:hypothetical protein